MDKKCGECKNYLPPEDFGILKQGADTLRAWCKKCVNAYNRQREFDRRQGKLEKRYKDKDRAIGFCKCGNYFKRVYFEGLSHIPKYKTSCKSCSK